MNILPKKRWHVRTKDNIARVRRDEAQAAEEERKREGKLQLAESEARINFLRKKSGLPEHQHDPKPEDRQGSTDSAAANTTSGHVDLFSDYKSHIQTTNKELEKEKKEEQEKYEKQIGYLTYLGQDTNEALKLRSWYEVAPKRTQVGDPEIVEKDLKSKFSQDPLTLINALLPPEKIEKRSAPKRPPTEVEPTIIVDVTPTKKPKKEKKSKKDKKKHKKNKKERKASRYEREQEERLQKREKLERLRRERLKREAAEKGRQEALLAPKTTQPKEQPKTVATPRVVQKYNSQFNPELAKQNQM